jgi:hypothetical protein
MFRTIFLASLALAVTCGAFAQGAAAFLGRWDFTVTPATGSAYPQWMELVETNGKLEGRVQPRGGGWVKILGAEEAAGKLVVSIYTATERRPAIRWELSKTGADRIVGIEKHGDNDGPSLVGVRAPKLDRPMPKA